jgi:hypothetical protein
MYTWYRIWSWLLTGCNDPPSRPITATVAYSPRNVPWWNKELSSLKSQRKQLFNRAKITGDWDSYRKSNTRYNKEIRKAKRSSWRENCWDIEDVAGGAKIMRIMAKESTNKVSSVKLPDSRHTQT